MRNPDKCQELTTLQQHPNCSLLILDVIQANDRQNVVQWINHHFDGMLDCLINNAGYGLFGAFEELTESQIRAEIEVNIMGLMFLTQVCLPLLRKAKGRIFNFSSVLGYIPMPMQSLYVTSKYAVEGFSESLYYELLPHGVQLCIVEPGRYGTRFGDNAIFSQEVEGLQSVYGQQRLNALRLRQNLKQHRKASPFELAKKIFTLANQNKMPLRYRFGTDAKLLYLLRKLMPANLYQIIFKRVYAHLVKANN